MCRRQSTLCDEIERTWWQGRAQGLGTYDARGDGNIQLNQAVLSTQTDAMISDDQPPPRSLRALRNAGGHFSLSLLDQVNHNDGHAHDSTCHQITNHTRQHSDKFKDFLLLQDNHEDISDLESHIHKMGQNGA